MLDAGTGSEFPVVVIPLATQHYWNMGIEREKGEVRLRRLYCRPRGNAQPSSADNGLP
jgi:hypothetical protein